ncbi:DUF4350 domain-containing protein [Spongiimicrobium salis]|uniref:DUF4350 domain-containing protein n=1 Tax=Spongiimicrobium salis TaxID=1667022 RepID=UPI00374CF814
MGKRGLIYIILGSIAIGGILLMEYTKPKKINWFPSFASHHKIPFGTYVFNQLIEKKFDERVRQVSRPPYEFLNNSEDIRGTYIFINQSVQFGDAELQSLLDWTSKGNTLFIASEGFEENFMDALGTDTRILYGDDGIAHNYVHQLVHPELNPNRSYSFEKDYSVTYFSEIDTAKTTILGVVDSQPKDSLVTKTHYNGIEQEYGEGKIILSTFPKAFTNYFILKEDNKDYTAGLLSYVENSGTIYMDNYYKAGKSFYSSPMYIFLNNRELKWAYYMALIGVVFYVIFEGKRKQRAIPVVKPLKNQTLAFSRTIADMYFEKGEQKEIADFKIEYFLEFIRSRFYLSTVHIDQRFYQNLASRSNHSVEEIETLFSFLISIKNSKQVSDANLKKLNTFIEKFKAKANGK